MTIALIGLLAEPITLGIMLIGLLISAIGTGAGLYMQHEAQAKSEKLYKENAEDSKRKTKVMNRNQLTRELGIFSRGNLTAALQKVDLDREEVAKKRNHGNPEITI